MLRKKKIGEHCRKGFIFITFPTKFQTLLTKKKLCSLHLNENWKPIRKLHIPHHNITQLNNKYRQQIRMHNN